MVDKKILTKLN